MILNVPCKIPAAPHPAMTRPMIKQVEFGAAAQRHDPTEELVSLGLVTPDFVHIAFDMTAVRQNNFANLLSKTKMLIRYTAFMLNIL